MKSRVILAMAAAYGVMMLFAQQSGAGRYIQDQAATGRATYQTYYASCHAENLSGREGPQEISSPNGVTGPPVTWSTTCALPCRRAAPPFQAIGI